MRIRRNVLNFLTRFQEEGLSLLPRYHLMDIRIYDFIEGARSARGLTVIIDVFRAFSVDCYIMAKGAAFILPVGDIDLAYRLKKEHPSYFLVGERNEQIMPGFDFGNSPYQIREADFTGKGVIHTTSAGTQGIVNAIHADEVLTGSFVNAQAIIAYIRQQKPEQVSLVCMGYNASIPADEDTLCAAYIKMCLEGIEPDFSLMKEQIRKGSGQRFFIQEKQHFAPAEDFDLCLNLNAFPFVLRARDRGEILELEKINML